MNALVAASDDCSRNGGQLQSQSISKSQHVGSLQSVYWLAVGGIPNSTAHELLELVLPGSPGDRECGHEGMPEPPVAG